MPRIVLECTIIENGQPKKVKYCIWCDEVPPPLGGGPGMLVIPNVIRKYHGPPGGQNSYEYLEIPLLDDTSDPLPPEDIYITLRRSPDDATNPGEWALPENGSRMGPHDDIVAFSIKLTS
jgi:hypothetical protein